VIKVLNCLFVLSFYELVPKLLKIKHLYQTKNYNLGIFNLGKKNYKKLIINILGTKNTNFSDRKMSK